MKLHLEAIAQPTPAGFAASTLPVSSPTDINLSLTVNFGGEQEIKVPGGKRLGLPGGRARFGISRGELRFVLKNCNLPLEKIALSKPFKVSIEVERQQSRSSQIQASAALDSRNIGVKRAEGATETVTLEVFQVKKVGSEEQPAWIFEAYGDRTILDGMFQEELLGTLCITEAPCEMSTTFTARGEDIRITWGKLGMTADIHRNKLAMIERAIALRYLKPLVESEPICQGRWQRG
ncbi:MAG: hypothetical protein AAFY26_13150 [Cyanobacteria bacterium J06638_22]